MELVIKVLLDERPWIYQDEIAEFLLEVFDVTVYRITISRTLKRIHITRKKLTVTVT
jgi:arginine repressor